MTDFSTTNPDGTASEPQSTAAQETTPDTSGDPRIIRHRHELRRRELSVTGVTRLSPVMIRLTLSGDDLAGFVSAAPDDHIKLFVPETPAIPDTTGTSDTSQEMARRDYTPRRYTEDSLLIDVVDHPGGPAADWARAVAVGDQAIIAGPRGSAEITGEIAQWLLIGDETALPAIGRRIEELPDGTPVTSIVGVPTAEDEQELETGAQWSAHWLHRPLARAADPAPYLAALDAITLAPSTFVWIGAEASVARALRNRLLERGHPKTWIKASGYWVKGEADASVKSLED